MPFGQTADGRAGYKEAMQRSIARIEHAQGLQSEQHARYAVTDEHVVRIQAATERQDFVRAGRPAPLRQEILEFENQSGFASFTRIARDLAAPILGQVSTWQDAHRQLAAVGIGIRPTRKGGELFAGDEHVKLSNVGRDLSWPKLTAPNRLGSFEEAPADLQLAHLRPRVIDADKASAWLSRQEVEGALKAQIDRRIANLMAQRDQATGSLGRHFGAMHADLEHFEGDPVLHRDLVRALPRLRKKSVEVLRNSFARQIEAVRGLRQSLEVEPFLEDIDQDEIGALDSGCLAPWGALNEKKPESLRLEGFYAEQRELSVCYFDRQRSPHDRGRPAFVDAGSIIWLNERSDASVEAMLTLAKAKYGSVAAFGDRNYLDQCARIGARLGIEIEEITVQEARRRARRTNDSRTAERRSVVERELRDRWANRFSKAAGRAIVGPEPENLADAAHVEDIRGVRSLPLMPGLDVLPQVATNRRDALPHQAEMEKVNNAGELAEIGLEKIIPKPQVSSTEESKDNVQGRKFIPPGIWPGGSFSR